MKTKETRLPLSFLFPSSFAPFFPTSLIINYMRVCLPPKFSLPPCSYCPGYPSGQIVIERKQISNILNFFLITINKTNCQVKNLRAPEKNT